MMTHDVDLAHNRFANDHVARCLTFDRTGKSLWVLRGVSTIEVRAWPSLEIIHSLNAPASLIAADPTQDRFAVVSSEDVMFIGAHAETIGSMRLPSNVCLCALAFDCSGVLFGLDMQHNQVRLLRLSPLDGRFEVEGLFELPSHARWAALAPTKGRAFFVLNGSPIEWNFRAPVRDPDDFSLSVAKHNHGYRRPWLSVDVDARDRTVIFSDKVQRSYVGWLDAAGEIEKIVVLEKNIFSSATGMKCPNRGAAAALHPGGDEVVFVDIIGRLTVCDAHEGRVVRDPVPLFGVGYRWEYAGWGLSTRIEERVG